MLSLFAERGFRCRRRWRNAPRRACRRSACCNAWGWRASRRSRGGLPAAIRQPMVIIPPMEEGNVRPQTRHLGDQVRLPGVVDLDPVHLDDVADPAFRLRMEALPDVVGGNGRHSGRPDSFRLSQGDPSLPGPAQDIGMTITVSFLRSRRSRPCHSGPGGDASQGSGRRDRRMRAPGKGR